MLAEDRRYKYMSYTLPFSDLVDFPDSIDATIDRTQSRHCLRCVSQKAELIYDDDNVGFILGLINL